MLSVSSYRLFAQTLPGSTSSGSYLENTGNGIDDPNASDLEQPVDSIGGKKERKPRKPLNSYLFNDSIKTQNVVSWNVNQFNNTIKMVAIDTMLRDFQKDYIFQNQEKVGSIYNGNLGGASVPLSFFSRANSQNFAFLDSYSAYFYTQDNLPYYNTKKPFTQLSYFMSGQTMKAEDQLRVTHAQNITPSTGFNISFRNSGTKGMYSSQTSRQKNLSLAVNHSGERYTFHGGYIYNMGNVCENGGVQDDSYIKDTLIDLSQNIPVNLKDARNDFYSHQVYFTQSYGFPFLSTGEEDTNLRDKSALFLGNSFSYTNAKRLYSDTQAESVEGFYENWYLNSERSQDSIRERVLDAKFFIQLQPYDRDGILSLVDGGVGYTYESYYYFDPSQYVTNSSSTNFNHNSLYVYANGEGKVSRYFKWDGHFKYYPLGYRSQDMDINGNIEFRAFAQNKPIILSASVDYSMNNPSFFSQHFYSNHFRWNNSFNKEIDTRLKGALTIPDWGIEATIEQSIIDNKVYYNSASLPAQYNSALSVTGVYLQKDFRFYGINLENRVLLQWSSAQEVVPVPLFSANLTYYYEFNVVKNVLRMQVGVDGYYNTPFNSFGYNPATMQFYNQNSTTTGNYIWLDAFVSGKWKRLRFVIKLQHLNNELFGGRDYFQVANYPLNRRQLKFGVSWNFYD